MSPFPNQHVIHPNYTEHHRPVPEGAMNSTCRIVDPGAGPVPYKGEGGTVLPPLYDGPCNVQSAAGDSNPVQGQQPQTINEYLVTFPVGLIPTLNVGERGHIIAVYQSSDPGLIGRKLRAKSMEFGSNVFERAVRCTDNQTQNR